MTVFKPCHLERSRPQGAHNSTEYNTGTYNIQEKREQKVLKKCHLCRQKAHATCTNMYTT